MLKKSSKYLTFFSSQSAATVTALLPGHQTNGSKGVEEDDKGVSSRKRLSSSSTPGKWIVESSKWKRELKAFEDREEEEEEEEEDPTVDCLIM